VKISIGGREFDVALGSDTVTVDGKEYAVRVRWDDTTPIVSVDGLPFRVELPEERGTDMTIMVDHRQTEVTATGTPTARPARRPARSSSGTAAAPAAVKGAVTAAMTGEIVEVHVAAGDRVNEGAILVILEAMKMRNEVLAPADGTVKTVEVQPGARVNQGDVLVVLADGDA
jgi:biotin carboxyl carrier protein